MSLDIKVYPLGPLQENTYLLIDEATNEKAIIDPGYFGDYVVRDIGDTESLKYVMLTHGHFDHVNAIKTYMQKYPNAKFLAPQKEKALMDKDGCPEADLYVSEGDEFELGKSKFRFIETPGHTAGGVCIIIGDAIFTGDTLFRLSVGNTTFETGNWEELIDSIKNKLYVLDENLTVYPGHGQVTSIGYEKRSNPFV